MHLSKQVSMRAAGDDAGAAVHTCGAWSLPATHARGLQPPRRGAYIADDVAASLKSAHARPIILIPFLK